LVYSLAWAWVVLPTFASATDYADAEAAFRDGTSKLKKMQYDEARSALEAALRLAPDDAFRLKVNEALVPVYRRLPEAEPMIGAQEFVIRHTPQRVSRSLAARSLTSFLFQRGLLDKRLAQYEDRLTKDPDDLVALSVLTAAYGTVKRNETPKTETAERLEKLERVRSAKQAEKFEAQAAAEPARAAQHWTDAAVAWRDSGDKAKAVAAADRAVQAMPQPDGILLHFHHRRLGEVFADCGRLPQAIEHLEKAVVATTIKGYQDDCRKKLDELRTRQVP
jgi:tetratricopeptide (TPR) repeat protein